MLRVAFLRLMLLVGVTAVAAGVAPTPDALPGLLVMCAVGVVLVAVTDGQRLLETAMSVSQSVSSVLVSALGRVVVIFSVPPARFEVVRRRVLHELTRRGAFRRAQRPDVAGKPQARAPGRA